MSCYAVDRYTNVARISKETRPRARQTYTCCECGEKIQVGERYQCVSGLWSNGWMAFRTCLRCAKVRSDYGGALFGDLREQILECSGIDYVRDPEALAAAYERMKEVQDG